MRRRGTILTLLIVALASVATSAARAADSSTPGDARVPPRLSYVYGDVSFWRPGVTEWSAAQVNTPLAAGDLLYVGEGGGVEVQIGPRAFVRAGAGTQLGLDSLEPDFLQVRLTGGHAALDLRSLTPGHAVELGTPNAVFSIERPGYYRAIVADEATTFVTRRGGRAVMTLASGEAVPVASNAQVVVRGTESPAVETGAAPELDVWDRWNYERTGAQLPASSSRYVPSGVYGAGDLDRYGSWGVVPQYGPVWVPSGVPDGWAPYSTGSWIWDPYYGWTWVDAAPWGWAPYHYGRWVFVDTSWAWAPGPFVVRPVYAPALVAFFGIGIRGPIGWCALGWGEPLIPWWGPGGFIGKPWWAGWGGPFIVNKVVINKTIVVNVTNVTVFQNVNVKNAVVVVDRDRFGHGPVKPMKVTGAHLKELRPLSGGLEIKPTPASLVATGPAARPPDRLLGKRVVATRPPHDRTPVLRDGVPGTLVAPAASAKIVPRPPRGHSAFEALKPTVPRPGVLERPEPPARPSVPVSARPSGRGLLQAQVPAPGAPEVESRGLAGGPRGRGPETVRPEPVQPPARPAPPAPAARSAPGGPEGAARGKGPVAPPAPSQVQPGPARPQPGPAQTQPGPVEVQPAPVQVQPGPVRAKPGSPRIAPGPRQVQQAPVMLQQQRRQAPETGGQPRGQAPHMGQQPGRQGSGIAQQQGEVNEPATGRSPARGDGFPGGAGGWPQRGGGGGWKTR